MNETRNKDEVENVAWEHHENEKGENFLVEAIKKK
jgi:hypothetical protein